MFLTKGAPKTSSKFTGTPMPKYDSNKIAK